MVAFETFRSLYFKALRERDMSVSQLVRYGFILNELSDFMGYTAPDTWTPRDLELFFEYRKPHLKGAQREEVREALDILSLVNGGGETQPPAIFSSRNESRATRLTKHAESNGDIGTGVFASVEVSGRSQNSFESEETSPRQRPPAEHTNPGVTGQWARSDTDQRSTEAEVSGASLGVVIDVIPEPDSTILALTWGAIADDELSQGFEQGLELTKAHGGARWLIDTRHGDSRVVGVGHWFPHWLEQSHRMGVEHCAVVVRHAQDVNLAGGGRKATSRVGEDKSQAPRIAVFESLGVALEWLRDP